MQLSCQLLTRRRSNLLMGGQRLIISARFSMSDVLRRPLTNITKEMIFAELDQNSITYENILKQGAHDASADPDRFAVSQMRLMDKTLGYAMKIFGGGYVLQSVNGRLVLPSGTTDNHYYRTDGILCNCEAGMHGQTCKHMIFAQAIEFLIAHGAHVESSEPLDDIPF